MGQSPHAAFGSGLHDDFVLERGRFRARCAKNDQDLAAARALRAKAFDVCDDGDAFDAPSTHILIEETASGRLVCCYRLLTVAPPDAAKCYSAQFYDLSALTEFEGPLMEMGRFCVAKDLRDADVLRLAWAAMTARVDAAGVALLFGCTSFAGVDPRPYRDAFRLLHARHAAPARWCPRQRADEVVAFCELGPLEGTALQGLRAMPPLLRTYLAMGGWVSDHAVIDRQMNTLHVFTGVEISEIPEVRQRLLRALV